MMKQMMVTSLLLIAAFGASAQTNPASQDSMVWQYADIGYCRLCKFSVSVLCSDQTKEWFKTRQLLAPKSQNSLIFANHVECLNYLSANGWILVHTYIESSSGGELPSASVPHFLMKHPEPLRRPVSE